MRRLVFFLSLLLRANLSFCAGAFEATLNDEQALLNAFFNDSNVDLFAEQLEKMEALGHFALVAHDIPSENIQGAIRSNLLEFVLKEDPSESESFRLHLVRHLQKFMFRQDEFPKQLLIYIATSALTQEEKLGFVLGVRNNLAQTPLMFAAYCQDPKKFAFMLSYVQEQDAKHILLRLDALRQNIIFLLLGVSDEILEKHNETQEEFNKREKNSIECLNIVLQSKISLGEKITALRQSADLVQTFRTPVFEAKQKGFGEVYSLMKNFLIEHGAWIPEEHEPQSEYLKRIINQAYKEKQSVIWLK